MTELLPAAPFAPMVRRAWRTYTYGEMAAITGVSPTTLHAVMHGDREFLRVRTAVKLKALQEVLPSTTDP